MKTCAKCSRDLPLEAFASNKARPDGHQTNCRECHSLYTRKHYKEHKAQYVAKARRRTERLKGEIRKAKDKPCADCGKVYPYWVMHFDHLRDKEFHISTEGRSVTEERLWAEIAKCEVVCANCHAERTHSRACGVIG